MVDPSSYSSLLHASHDIPTMMMDDNPDAGFRVCIAMETILFRSWRSFGVRYSYPCLEQVRTKPVYLEKLDLTTWMAFTRDINDARRIQLADATRITSLFLILSGMAVLVCSMNPRLVYYGLLSSIVLLISSIVQNWLLCYHFRTVTVPALHTVVDEWKEKLFDQPDSYYRMELMVEEDVVCCGCVYTPFVYLVFQRSSISV
jgi:hypothetical protein